MPILGYVAVALAGGVATLLFAKGCETATEKIIDNVVGDKKTESEKIPLIQKANYVSYGIVASIVAMIIIYFYKKGV